MNKKVARGEKSPPPASPIIDDSLLTVTDFTALLKVKKTTYYSWESRGVDLPPRIKISGTTRFRKTAVLEWLKEKETARRKKDFEV